MINEITNVSLNKDFESIKKVDKNGIEYWHAKELMPLLGYPNWEKAEEVIARAARACINSGQSVDNHFHQTVKMVEIGSIGWLHSGEALWSHSAGILGILAPQP